MPLSEPPFEQYAELSFDKEYMLEASIAISLKRIANSLDEIRKLDLDRWLETHSATRY